MNSRMLLGWLSSSEDVDRAQGRSDVDGLGPEPPQVGVLGLVDEVDEDGHEKREIPAQDVVGQAVDKEDALEDEPDDQVPYGVVPDDEEAGPDDVDDMQVGQVHFEAGPDVCKSLL